MTGKEFRRWRRLNDITQQQIADVIDIDRTSISRYEQEKYCSNYVIDLLQKYQNEYIGV